MNCVAIIPARQGSVRLPNKNKLELAGKPLISWTIEAALESGVLDQIIVTTNDSDIKNIAKSYNGVLVVDRPCTLATPSSTSLEVVNHALESHQYLHDDDLIVTLQPTSPIRSPFDIKKSTMMMCTCKEADSLVSVSPVKHYATSDHLFTLGRDNVIISGSPLDHPTSHQFYSRNGASIYITRFKNISRFIYGGMTIAYIMPSLRSIDIDTYEDFLLADAVMSNARIFRYATSCA